jgi:hypothetical protein
MARLVSEYCRNGHRMAGGNLIWHARYDADDNKTYVRECRACAAKRREAIRLAAKRNRELELEALEGIREGSYAAAENYLPASA